MVHYWVWDSPTCKSSEKCVVGWVQSLAGLSFHDGPISRYNSPAYCFFHTVCFVSGFGVWHGEVRSSDGLLVFKYKCSATATSGVNPIQFWETAAEMRQKLEEALRKGLNEGTVDDEEVTQCVASLPRCEVVDWRVQHLAITRVTRVDLVTQATD